MVGGWCVCYFGGGIILGWDVVYLWLDVIGWDGMGNYVEVWYVCVCFCLY